MADQNRSNKQSTNPITDIAYKSNEQSTNPITDIAYKSNEQSTNPITDIAREPNKRPTNTIVDAIDESHFLTELERIGARAGRKTVLREELERRIKSEGKLLNKLLEEGEKSPIIKEGPFYEEQVSALRENIKNIRSRMNSLQRTAITRAESEASTYISRQFSQQAINAESSRIMRQSETQNRALTMIGKPYDELEARREEILAEIRASERGALGEVKGMFDRTGQVRPESSATLGAMMSSTQERIKELAVINAAQQLQRRTGQDPQSRMQKLVEMGQEANKVLKAEDVAKEIRQGSVNITEGGETKKVKREDIQEEYIRQAKILADSLSKLSQITEKSGEKFEALQKAAGEAAENMEKLKTAESVAGRTGLSGIQKAQLISSGFYAVSGLMQEVMINQRLGQVNNATGFANLANQQYDMYRKARSGDILSQLTLGQFGRAEDMAEEMGKATNLVQGAQITAGVVQAGVGAAQAAEGTGQKFNLFSWFFGNSTKNTEAIIQGAQNFMQGSATAAATGMDALRGVQKGQNMLAGAQATINAVQAINYVGATQAQGLRDFYTQLDVAAQGAGSRAGEFLKQSISNENIDAMINARISPEQFAQMSQIGLQQIGSTFKVDQVFAARNLERGGFGSMQENMQRMATLANAGANNPREGLENVLSAAMTKGLDNSKALNLMVENTAAMVQQSAAAMAAGVDTTAANASLLASSVNEKIENKEFAISRAATAQEALRNVVTDTSVSYAGMLNTARIQQTTGIGGIDAIFAAELSTAEIKAMQKMDPNKAKEALLNQGINIGNKDVGEFLRQMLEAQMAQAFTGAGALAYGTNEIRESLLKKALSGTDFSKLTDEEKATLGKMGKAAGNLTGEEYYNTVRGIKEAQVTTGTKGADAAAGKGADSLKTLVDDLRTSGLKQASEAIKSAAEKLEKFGGALQVFTELQKKYEEGGVKNEEDFAQAAATMAKDFKVSIGKFDTATTKYEQASQAIINHINGLKSNRNPLVPEAATDLLDKFNKKANKLKGLLGGSN